MENIAVQVENLTKEFESDKTRGLLNIIRQSSSKRKNKKFVALDNVTFSVKKGEVLGIIGANGSGKSTLLRIIAGVYKPDSGNVIVNGRLSPLMQLGAGFQNELTAKDNIVMNGLLLGVSKSTIEKKVEVIIEYAELDEFRNLKIKHYSSGMRAKLAFAIAMQVNPEILLVDEILSVGDINFRKKSIETFLSFKNNGRTILLASHNLETLSTFCDRVLVLQKGRMVIIGDPEEAIAKYQTIK